MACWPKYDRSNESSSIRTNNNEMMKELTVGKLVIIRPNSLLDVKRFL